MSNIYIREDFIVTARVVTMHVNSNMMPRFMESTMTSRMIDCVRMNPPIFLVSKVNEDSKEFLDKVYNVLSAMALHLWRRRRGLHTN